MQTLVIKEKSKFCNYLPAIVQMNGVILLGMRRVYSLQCNLAFISIAILCQ